MVKKILKEPYLLAAILFVLFLTWLDFGSAGIGEQGFLQWLQDFFGKALAYFVIYGAALFIAVGIGSIVEDK